jgi:hypothetical protein
MSSPAVSAAFSTTSGIRSATLAIMSFRVGHTGPSGLI